MRPLDERRWLTGGGAEAPEWRAVARRRTSDALQRLERIEREAARRLPKALARGGLLAGLRYFLKAGGARRERLLGHPALDHWLTLWDRHFSRPVTESDWRLQFGQFQAFAASLALLRRDALELAAHFDPNGRLTLFELPVSLVAPQGKPQGAVALKIGRGAVLARGEGFEAEWSPGATASAPWRKLAEVGEGLVVDDSSWLVTKAVVMHGLARLSEEETERFASPLRAALEDLRRRAPGLHSELRDMVRVLVPLQNQQDYGSVSSSYVELRGAICLSPAEDRLLQAETLIHEFCHQKMNQLLVVDPLLLPGQSCQVFYSPWRPDARRLRGLMLGAHAFLNVGRFLARSIVEETFPEPQQIELMVNVARRAFQCELALRSLSCYASLTEFGRRFLLGLWREQGLLRHSIQWFPPALIEEQRQACEEHRRTYCVGETGIHKGAGVNDKVRRVPFLAPKAPDDEPGSVPA